MVKYICEICRRDFSTASGLTQHANAKHVGRTSLSQSYTQPQRLVPIPKHIPKPEHDENLWSKPILMPRPQSQSQSQSQLSTTLSTSYILEETSMISQIINDNYDEMEDVEYSNVNMSEPHYNLRSRAIETEEDIEELETELQLPVTLKEIDIDPEDLQGATLDDALDTIEGKNKPDHIAEWPNDAYRDFMELIIEGNISNKIGDKIINFFNKHSDLKKSPLPNSTKNGKDYLNQISSPSVDFKEKVVASYSGVNIKLYYRPIFHTIQALIQRPEVAENFVCKGAPKFTEDKTRIFGELYEGDWWLKTEKTLPPLNNLLSIILYSDATTFDGLGKTSGHPVFLTLGNLPNWFRNSPESKVLLGFLPKVQGSGIKTTESFRSFQREIFHKCFNIMLRPLLEKPDKLYFGIKGREMMFAARISVFLADMLEANEITVTYKSAHCKMPCHTCMVLRDNLNKMDCEFVDSLRTHENMQKVISNGQEKDFSVHSTENAFWKFP